MKKWTLEYQEYFYSLSPDTKKKILARDREDACFFEKVLLAHIKGRVEKIANILSNTSLKKSEEDIFALFSSPISSEIDTNLFANSDEIIKDNRWIRLIKDVQREVNELLWLKWVKRSYNEVLIFLWIKKAVDIIFHPKFSLLIDELDINVRVENFLKDRDIQYVGQVVPMSEYDLIDTSGYGLKSLEVLKEALADHGLYLGMKVGDWVVPRWDFVNK